MTHLMTNASLIMDSIKMNMMVQTLVTHIFENIYQIVKREDHKDQIVRSEGHKKNMCQNMLKERIQTTVDMVDE